MAESRPTKKIWEVSYGSENGLPSLDPRSFFFTMAPEFIRQARDTRKREAESHRGVLVGSTALVTNPLNFTSRAYIGFNYTPYRGAPKHCAEMRALGRAMSHGYTQQEGLVVAGPTDPDVIESIIRRITPTLPPCEPCSEIIHPGAVVLTIGGASNVAQAWTGGQLKELYTPVGLVSRRKREALLANRPAPAEFEVPTDHGAAFWANAAEEYTARAAAVVAKYETLGAQIDHQQDIRLMQAQAAVDSIYVAAAA